MNGETLFDLLSLPDGARPAEVEDALKKKIESLKADRSKAVMPTKRQEIGTSIHLLEVLKARIDKDGISVVLTQDRAEKKSRDEEMVKKIEEQINICLAVHSKVPEEKLKQLIADYPLIPADTIRKLAGVRKEDHQSKQKVEPIPDHTLKKIASLQARIKPSPRDLYEFLGVKSSGAETAAFLRQLAETKSRANINKNDDAKELASLALTVFSTEEKRRGYDEALHRQKLDAFLPALRMAVHNGMLPEKGLTLLLEKMGDAGFEEHEATTWIAGMATKEHFKMPQPTVPTLWHRLRSAFRRLPMTRLRENIERVVESIVRNSRFRGPAAWFVGKRMHLLRITCALFGTSFALLQYGAHEKVSGSNASSVQSSGVPPGYLSSDASQALTRSGWEYLLPNRWHDLILLSLRKPAQFTDPALRMGVTAEQVRCIIWGRRFLIPCLVVLPFTLASWFLHMLRQRLRKRQWERFMGQAIAFRWPDNLTNAEAKYEALKDLPESPGYLYLRDDHLWSTQPEIARQATGDRLQNTTKLFAAVHDALSHFAKKRIAGTVFGRSALIAVDSRRGRCRKVHEAVVYTVDHIFNEYGRSVQTDARGGGNQFSLARLRSWNNLSRVTFAIVIERHEPEEISVFAIGRCRRTLRETIGRICMSGLMLLVCLVPFVGLFFGLRSCWAILVETTYNRHRFPADDYRTFGVNELGNTKLDIDRKTHDHEVFEKFYRDAFASAQANILELATLNPVR